MPGAALAVLATSAKVPLSLTGCERVGVAMCGALSSCSVAICGIANLKHRLCGKDYVHTDLVQGEHLIGKDTRCRYYKEKVEFNRLTELQEKLAQEQADLTQLKETVSIQLAQHQHEQADLKEELNAMIMGIKDVGRRVKRIETLGEIQELLGTDPSNGTGEGESKLPSFLQHSYHQAKPRQGKLKGMSYEALEEHFAKFKEEVLDKRFADLDEQLASVKGMFRAKIDERQVVPVVRDLEEKINTLNAAMKGKVSQGEIREIVKHAVHEKLEVQILDDRITAVEVANNGKLDQEKVRNEVKDMMKGKVDRVEVHPLIDQAIKVRFEKGETLMIGLSELAEMDERLNKFTKEFDEQMAGFLEVFASKTQFQEIERKYQSLQEIEPRLTSCEVLLAEVSKEPQRHAQDLGMPEVGTTTRNSFTTNIHPGLHQYQQMIDKVSGDAGIATPTASTNLDGFGLSMRRSRASTGSQKDFTAAINTALQIDAPGPTIVQRQVQEIESREAYRVSAPPSPGGEKYTIPAALKTEELSTSTAQDIANIFWQNERKAASETESQSPSPHGSRRAVLVRVRSPSPLMSTKVYQGPSPSPLPTNLSATTGAISQPYANPMPVRVISSRDSSPYPAYRSQPATYLSATQGVISPAMSGAPSHGPPLTGTTYIMPGQGEAS